ncbi:Ig-like domain-containing protein [Streptomyces sp. NPDC094032]|uniref:L,D-transpeptidase n=1 Tax=Streptomyces sp. NPDC094032 TaxID=3155308 RepID=UPI0033346829
MHHSRRAHRRLAAAAFATTALLTAGACAAPAAGPAGQPKAPSDSASPGTTSLPDSAAEPVALSPLAGRAGGADESVIPGEPLTVTAPAGRLESVSVTGADGKRLDGRTSPDGTAWVSSHGTGYGARYTVSARVNGADGSARTVTRSFTTLRKSEIFVGTYNVNQGSTVGVALPVSVVFNKPIHDRAAIERKLSVTASPAVEGSWSWMKDRDGKDRVDYRPKEYWKPGTKVTFRMDLVGVRDGALVGTQKREIGFTVGKAVTSTVDVVRKTMTVSENGRPLRTLKVSTGKKTFETWNGTMVVLSKVPTIRMNSATVGIFGQEAYDLGAVKWDVQLTPSGTYAHAAPWNEGKFGRVNASHGCIGMSDADAKWFYDRVDFGDPVTVVNSVDTVAVNNGYGAWNVDWATWRKGSALD